MGSHSTLDHHNETRERDADRVDLAQHPHVRTWPNDRVQRAETQESRPTPADQRRRAIDQRATRAQLTTRELEQAFDRLNPEFGVPADTYHPLGHQDVRDREAALALGTRVAVATSRENDRNPVMWLAGQDYRVADAARTVRLPEIKQRHGPERVGPER
jgi:hypothetical protein